MQTTQHQRWRACTRSIFPRRSNFKAVTRRMSNNVVVSDQSQSGKQRIRGDTRYESSSRRRALRLIGLAPVCCCAGCKRSSFMDEVFAQSMATGMVEYEREIAPLKSMLFRDMRDGLSQNGSQANVLEIGIGTGPNLGYYPSNGVRITGVDPNRYMLPYLHENAQKTGFPNSQLTWMEGIAEDLPLPDNSMEAVVCTLVLCSVPDVAAVLQEVRRVLRPGGTFMFIEHTIASKSQPLLQLGQQVLDPLQQWLADGCHLTRDPLPAIQTAGFAAVDARRFTVEGHGLIGPHVAGLARL